MQRALGAYLNADTPLVKQIAHLLLQAGGGTVTAPGAGTTAEACIALVDIAVIALFCAVDNSVEVTLALKFVEAITFMASS